MKFFYLFILLTSIGGCQLGDNASHRAAKQATTPSPIATFVSQGNHYADVLLTLQEDSTYQLRVSFAPQESVRTPLNLQGKWTVNENYYQLYFSDTLAQINDLFAPIPGDASLVIYPDHSVAMDTALQQFYVLGVVVERQ